MNGRTTTIYCCGAKKIPPSNSHPILPTTSLSQQPHYEQLFDSRIRDSPSTAIISRLTDTPTDKPARHDTALVTDHSYTQRIVPQQLSAVYTAVVAEQSSIMI